MKLKKVKTKERDYKGRKEKPKIIEGKIKV